VTNLPPTGTVTMYFSDIEGSTVLLRRLGARFGEALSAHRALHREAVTRWHGVELRTEGDSFFVVFASPLDAVRACLDVQLAHARHPWPDGADVRVRIGVHTGEAQRHENDYLGLEVHRAARIAATAHGGQVVLSDRTRQLVVDSLPPGVSVRDLGQHRLKDFPAPERIHQLVAPDLPAEFPRLRSLGAPSNLPVPPSPLVGRDDAVADLIARISRGAPLVTLTGPGGTGKTRLAIAVAAALDAEFAAGVYFVPLAQATEAADLWTAIAQAMGASLQTSVRDAVLDLLVGRRILLVLDNLEQVTGAAATVADLIGAAPTVTALVTSRRALHLQTEQVCPVPTLFVPDAFGPGTATPDADTLLAAPAVELFVQRARMVHPGFTLTGDNARDVAAICVRLDGLPLAIELAAARVRFLPPDVLLRRLTRVLELSFGDADRPERHQTLRNTIAWSEQLLTPAQRTVFRRLGVFANGCDLDAFAAVAVADADDRDPLDVLEDLVDHGLVQLSFARGTRIEMLETIRKYAREQLADAGEVAGARRRHAEHYLTLTENIAERLRGAEHLAMVDRLEAEHDNLREALGWALEPTDEPEPARATIGLRLVSGLSWFWYGHGHGPEGRRWLERAVDAVSDEATPELGKALHGLGVLLLQQGQTEAGQAVLEHSLVLARAAGDPVRTAQDLSSLGVAHRDRGDLDTARRLIEESVALARQTTDLPRLATALSNLAVVEMDVGNADGAVTLLRETSAIDHKLDDQWGLAVDQTNLAYALLRAGLPDQAWATLASTAPVAVELGDIDLTIWVIEGFAATCAALGRPLAAATLAGATDQLRATHAIPHSDPDAAQLERYLGPTRAGTPREAWENAFATGRQLSHEDALAFARREIGRPDRWSPTLR
jgi:predicted ATPase/class 3 adenylate cyclase